MTRLAEKAQTDNGRRSSAKEKLYPLLKLAASVNWPSRCQASEQTLNYNKVFSNDLHALHDGQAATADEWKNVICEQILAQTMFMSVTMTYCLDGSVFNMFQ